MTRSDIIKKIFSLLIITLLTFTIIGCTNKIPIKPEYEVNEQAIADEIELLLNEVVYNETQQTLRIKIKMTNKRDNTVTIKSDEMFKLYDINKVQIPNNYTNSTNIIKKDETITYILEYNVAKKEIYELYFYSGIVENNIRFNITSKDIIYSIE